MIDNMQGLYGTALDAYEAGKRTGASDACRHALSSLSRISSQYETAGDATAFRAAEECCAAVREVRRALKGAEAVA